MSDHDAPPADPDSTPADPEDLDFTDDENVVEIGEGRYVVGTNGRPNVGSGRPSRDTAPPQGAGAANAGESGFESPTTPSPAADRDPIAGEPQAAGSESAADGPGSTAGTGAGAGAGGTIDRQAVSRWLASSFEHDGFDYGFDATLHANGSTSRNRSTSNDVVATFDTLLSWFVSNAGPESPPPEAIGLLLVAADTPVELPPVTIKRFAASHGLSADDSIGDLIRAAEDAGGFRID